jgi:hypothetical protein
LLAQERLPYRTAGHAVVLWAEASFGIEFLVPFFIKEK